MEINGLILTLPKELRYLIISFLLILSVGFYSSISMVRTTSTFAPQGVQENYLGNEDDENAIEMKFKKTERQVLGMIHSHIISMSIMFLLLGFFVSLTKLSYSLKMFLIIEPFFSVLLTFGGIYFLWCGLTIFKYVIVFSGILMTLSFAFGSIIVLAQATFPKVFLNN